MEVKRIEETIAPTPGNKESDNMDADFEMTIDSTRRRIYAEKTL